jgi:TatD DNase family protein
MKWIDAHTHLDAEELYPSLADVLKRSENAGISKILAVNSEANEQSFLRTLSCIKKAEPISIFASLGVHPHEAKLYNDQLEKLLMQSLATTGVIALGEIGLDFYYNHSPREVQEAVLSRQLQLALDLKLPVAIHCRDGYDVLVTILKRLAPEWHGMIHCFTGNSEEAQELLTLGFYISFSGIVTFPKADILRKAATVVPLDRILIETDAPYLAPVPHRGKRNEPSFVIHTGLFLAGLKQIPPETLSRALQENFSRLFSLPNSSLH